MLFIWKRLQFTFLIVHAIIHCSISTTTREKEAFIQKSILENYHQYSRPENPVDPDLPLYLYINIGLTYIRSFDEKLGILSSALTIQLAWHDSDLSWDIFAEHGGLTQTKLPRNKIWYPPFCLSNPADGFLQVGDDREEEFLTIHGFMGLIIWDSIETVKTICAANALYYPFDQQNCSIEFFPFYYHKEEVKVFLNKDKVNLTNYEENLVWDLKSATISDEPTPDGYFVMTVVHLLMKRRPMYFVVNVILPMLLIGILNVFVFLLPADSGERVGFSITMLLAMAVFLTIVSDNLPESISIVSLLLICDLALSVLIVIFVILGLRLHFEDPETKVSRKYIKFYSFLKCACCKNKSSQLREYKHQNKQIGSLSSSLSLNHSIQNWSSYKYVDDHKIRQNDTFASLKYDKTQNMYNRPNTVEYRQHTDTYRPKDEHKVTWKDIGNLMDKVCFWSFSILQVAKLVAYAVLYGIQK